MSLIETRDTAAGDRSDELIAPAPAGLYVHVPFCRAKCPYCDFYSTAAPDLIPTYIQALLSEINLYRHKITIADTIYFGGGTPSMLTPGQVEWILEAIQACFVVTADAEVTLEVNPGTVDRQALRDFGQAGVNRLNIGLQSIDDRNLNFLGRIHSARQGIDTYHLAREIGYANVGLDLIYGLPDQTHDGWISEMTAAAKLAPDHLSCYTLTIEPGTPMAQRVDDGRMHPLDEQVAADLFSATAACLDHYGYRQYEISNYALQTAGNTVDNRSRHNRKYWTLAPYLGFGPAAHSFQGNTRWWNHRSLPAYLTDLQSAKHPLAGVETLTREQQIMEFIYLGLRQTNGIDTVEFASRFKTDFYPLFESEVMRLIAEGLLETEKGWVRLTQRGMRFLDRVVDRLLG